jgi:hypothetical protein
MVYSSMVHVAGGEGSSTRHDDDNRPVNVRDLLGGQQILFSVAGVGDSGRVLTPDKS